MKEQNALVQSAVPKNTRNATEYWLRMFGQFCDERSVTKVKLETVSGETLSTLLASFYTDAQTKKKRFRLFEKQLESCPWCNSATPVGSWTTAQHLQRSCLFAGQIECLMMFSSNANKMAVSGKFNTRCQWPMQIGWSLTNFSRILVFKTATMPWSWHTASGWSWPATFVYAVERCKLP